MKKLLYLLVVLSPSFLCKTTIAQAPSWSDNYGISNITDVYTGNGRPNVAAAFFNNEIWLAYTSSTCSTGCAIKIAYSAAPAPLSFTTPTEVSIPGVGVITSYNSPSLGVQNGYLYLAYNDASNANWLIQTQDGINWSAPYQLASGYTTTWAPGLVGDVNDSSRLYVGFADGSSYTPIICAVYPNTSNLPSSTQNCLGFTSLDQMNFNPGVTTWNQEDAGAGVIMAYEWRGNEHCLSGYLLNPETGYSYDYNASQNCSDQTSVVPSLATYENRLFLAWGGNNSSRQFNTRTTDVDEFDLIYKNTYPEGMNGSPTLLTTTPTGYYPVMFNFYVWNAQVRYMYTTS